MSRYAIGVDFGTESGRAVLVDVADGRQVATAVSPYRNGVIDERLPIADRDVRARPGLGPPGPRGLPAGLQGSDPGGPPRGRRGPGDVIGVGIDFTACTMLPTTADGTPLCVAPRASAPTRMPG